MILTLFFIFSSTVIVDSSYVYSDGIAEPFGLQTVGEVIQAEIPVDSLHEAYQNIRPNIVDYLDDPANKSTVGTTTFFDPVSGSFLGGELVESNEIVLPFDAQLRMYFIRETASFSNSLGFVNGNTDILDVVNVNSLIFPLISADGVADQDFIGGPGFFLNQGMADAGELSLPEEAVLRQLTNPVDDFVDMGNFQDGDQLDFFLIPDGADVASDANIATVSPWWNPEDSLERDAPVWWTKDSLNIDVNVDQEGPTRHVRMAKFEDQGLTYYLMAWEDAPFPQNSSSYVDYNDAITVLQVTPISAPEPGTYLLFSGFLIFILVVDSYRTRRHGRIRRGAK